MAAPQYSSTGFTYSDSRLSYSTLSSGGTLSDTGPDYILYTLVNRSDWVIEPTFTVMRHRYRGPRQSYKYNLELGSLRFEIMRMRNQLDAMRTRFDRYQDFLIYGGTLELDAALVDVEGIYNLSSKVQTTIRRIKSLERS